MLQPRRVKHRKQHRGRRSGEALTGNFIAFGEFGLQAQGTENIPKTGGAVLVSNHISYLDFIFTGLGALPQKRLVRFMAKREIFDHRIGGPLMRGMHHIPVDREAGLASYREALAALKAGESEATASLPPPELRAILGYGDYDAKAKPYIAG